MGSAKFLLDRHRAVRSGSVAFLPKINRGLASSAIRNKFSHEFCKLMPDSGNLIKRIEFSKLCRKIGFTNKSGVTIICLIQRENADCVVPIGVFWSQKRDYFLNSALLSKGVQEELFDPLSSFHFFKQRGIGLLPRRLKVWWESWGRSALVDFLLFL